MDLDTWRANCPYTYLYTKMLTTYNHFLAFWLRLSVVSVLISKNVGCLLIHRKEQVSHWRRSNLSNLRSVISLHSKSSIPTHWLTEGPRPSFFSQTNIENYSFVVDKVYLIHLIVQCISFSAHGYMLPELTVSLPVVLFLLRRKDWEGLNDICLWEETVHRMQL